MNPIRASQSLLLASLTLGMLPSAHAVEIYKWVDDKGQTHYSSRKDDAGKASATELKIKPIPPSAPASQVEAQYRRYQEDLARQAPPGSGAQNFASRNAPRPAAATPPRPLSGGRADETDTSKCNLARDVLSGAVRHRNGAPTDANDRQVAESDIRLFCGK